jgi:hypothetical protein
MKLVPQMPINVASDAIEILQPKNEPHRSQLLAAVLRKRRTGQWVCIPLLHLPLLIGSLILFQLGYW